MSPRASLAEFSRLYVLSRTLAPDTCGDRASARPQTFENSFAIQISRGMLKGDREFSLENEPHAVDRGDWSP